MPVEPGPLTVRRSCGLPPSVLRRLGSDRVWSAARLLRQADEVCRRLGRDVADGIGEMLPAAPAPQRRILLKLRRDAYNGRPVPVGLAMTGEVEAAALRYQDALAAHRRAADELRAALEELSAGTQHALLATLDDTDFSWSVELSVPGLSARARGGIDAARGARSRRIALTLLRLAQRAATKPSPFARFAQSAVLAGDDPEPGARSHLRVDRQVIDWVQRWVSGPGHRVLDPRNVWLTANPTAGLDSSSGEPRLCWLVSDERVSERFVTAPYNTRLAALLRDLRAPVRLSAVAPGGVMPPIIERMLERGLVEVGLRPSDEVRDTLGSAMSLTGPAGRSGVAEESRRDIEAALRVLHLAESSPATGDPGDVVRPASAAVGRLARACGVTGYQEGGRPVVTEDYVGAGTPRSSPSSSAHPLRGELPLAELATLQRVLPLLGVDLPYTLAGQIAFEDHFGTASVPFYPAYRWFAESGRHAVRNLLKSCAHPILDEVLRLRARFFAGLRELGEADPSAEEVRCDPRWLDDLAAALPRTIRPWACTAWVVQVDGGRLVLNGAGSGYGRFVGRIGATLAPDLLATLRTWAAEAATAEPDGMVVDITAGFGATANEHPLILPAALSYPGRALECDPRSRIDLASCRVRVENGRLHLRGDDLPGRTLLPVPHNATLPDLAPPLYRWLTGVGPSLGTSLALWDHVDALAGRDGVRAYPRLALGDLVLARRTWKVPAHEVPDQTGSTAAQAVRWRLWSERTGVPRRSFVRTASVPDPWNVVRGLTDEGEVAAVRDRAGAQRKPAYVDLSQPLNWPVPGGDVLTFTEPLPDPYEVKPDDRVTEYVIETTWSGT